MEENPDIQIENSLNFEKSSIDLLQDPIFSSNIRLAILFILNSNPQAGFTIIRKLLKITPGNMDYHTKILEDAEYLQKSKSFSFRRPMVILKITPKGKKAFLKYTGCLTELLNEKDGKKLNEIS